LSTERLLMAEPLAVVVRAVGRAAPVAGETAAVLGVGSLGLLAVQVLRARGRAVHQTARSGARAGRGGGGALGRGRRRRGGARLLRARRGGPRDRDRGHRAGGGAGGQPVPS